MPVFTPANYVLQQEPSLYSPLFYPESFGAIGQGNDADAIQIAGNYAQANGGKLILSQAYVLNRPLSWPNGPGFTIEFTGCENRQLTPPTFAGGSLQPANGFTGNTLITLGTVGNPNTNPNGMRLVNPTMQGVSPNATLIANLIGLLINDTSDVVLDRPQFANFDRTGGTGVAIKLTGSGTNNSVGLNIHHGVISTCWKAILMDGAGTTDMRFTKILFHSNTIGIDNGPSGGSSGGGMQMSDCHFVFSGAGVGAVALQMGTGAGDYNIHGNYFDKYGNNVHVVLTNSKGRFSGNHFLPDVAQAGPLVTLSTASQELNFCDNDCQANASAMTALFKLLAGAGGAPTNGVYVGNNVYGVHASLLSTFIDKNNVAVPVTATATTYVQGNVAE